MNYGGKKAKKTIQSLRIYTLNSHHVSAQKAHTQSCRGKEKVSGNYDFQVQYLVHQEITEMQDTSEE